LERSNFGSVQYFANGDEKYAREPHMEQYFGSSAISRFSSLFGLNRREIDKLLIDNARFADIIDTN
jgi:hypothetical protein